ncbi:glycosyltransferase family 2 protein [Paenibacillus illinoisensis]|uniref:glycosyltransferase family 2 protein n=1 Tax=Paenibacillus illinoisensis TaxID=59845 RepID=UPI0020400AB6|nr:glycosyltransferase family 2 protein [Paenibacillus illinoisensis]MCM3208244.1 glycosyltransferase family 2 protein [Paenibacillus illinoisensis]
MNLDVIIVTYNSEIWIENCIQSLSRSRYQRGELHLFIIDNGSTDSTISKIEQEFNKHESYFKSVKLIQNKKNKGFGIANNIAAAQGKSDYIFFLNVDTEVLEDSLFDASNVIQKSDDDIAAWEFRQFPYEHPKYYDPISLSTSWISGAAFIIRRSVFNEVNGFDKKIFMYAEDVDLSWRIRSKGYRLLYMPDCVIKHYSYKVANELKPNQFINSIINNLNLKVRYGSLSQFLLWHIKFCYMLLLNRPIKGVRGRLISSYIKNIWRLPSFFNLSLRKLKPTFYGWDYEVERTGGFYYNFTQRGYQPLVSILIRTIGRIELLNEALISIRNQTYSNIEVIIVEDGGAHSEKFIKEHFNDLNITFFGIEEKVGRSKAANIAMDKANGEFLNFLDEDDLLFPDHVEVLVNELSKHSYSVVYSVAFEVPTEYFPDRSKKEHAYRVVFKNKFNRLKLFYQNYLPIQCVMFNKELVRDKIYFDEHMDALEDWDFWVRLSLENDFFFVDKTTSLYRVPFNPVQLQRRQEILDSALAYARDKQKNYYCQMNGYEISEDIAELINRNQTNSLKNKYKLLYALYRFLIRNLNK